MRFSPTTRLRTTSVSKAVPWEGARSRPASEVMDSGIELRWVRPGRGTPVSHGSRALRMSANSCIDVDEELCPGQ